MRIISRLFSAAFDTRETTEDRFFIECVQCPTTGHAVMNGVESEEEYASWQVEHHKATQHTQFMVYRMQRGSSRLFI